MQPPAPALLHRVGSGGAQIERVAMLEAHVGFVDGLETGTAGGGDGDARRTEADDEKKGRSSGRSDTRYGSHGVSVDRAGPKRNSGCQRWTAAARVATPDTMFTGLVGATGVLSDRNQRGPGARLVIQARLAGEALAYGESINVDGACLSVLEVLPDGFSADATAETLARTTLGELIPGRGARVNLERSLRAGDRLGGHLVTGHVDGVGSVAARRAVGEALSISFLLPAELVRYVAEKGSIAINGTSMTVNAVSDHGFEVMVIPITREETNLGALEPGARVNLEVDLVARYVARFLATAPA
jgi:riboflavin synthase